MSEAAATSPALESPPRPALLGSESAPEHYTVIVRGVKFELSYAQITYDSPNHFTTAFLEHDFAEAQSRTLFLDRNPQLFALIVEHLSGYTILPLAQNALPTTMSYEIAYRNLYTDAEYFGLEYLLQLLSAPVNNFYDTSASDDDIKLYLKFCGMTTAAADRAER